VLLLAACLLTGCDRAAAPPAALDGTIVPVAATPAIVGSVRSSVHASGVVQPADGAEFFVVAPETARLIEAPRGEGDLVASGDVLARFELTVATQEAARHRAEVARLTAETERARQAYARTSEFVDRGFVPRRDRDDAQRQAADAEAALDRATAALAAAETALTRAVVRAPFAGLVAARLHAPGDLVQGAATDPVLRLVDPLRLEIAATVDEADAARVVPGATARTTHPADGSPVPLTVSSVPQRQATPSGAAVRLTFQTPAVVPVDSRVDIEIDAEERDGVVFVPEEAVVSMAGERTVMVAAGDHAERRRVTTGAVVRGRIEIAGGLRAGELVITRGHVGLSDGAAISVAVESR
jgi:RND family efflux transporter MFP subunit